jgi:hypothetical protein
MSSDRIRGFENTQSVLGRVIGILTRMLVLTSVCAGQETKKKPASRDALPAIYKLLGEQDLSWKDQVARLNANEELLQGNRKRLEQLHLSEVAIVSWETRPESRWLKERLDALTVGRDNLKAQVSVQETLEKQYGVRLQVLTKLSKIHIDLESTGGQFLAVYNKLTKEAQASALNTLKDFSVESLLQRQRELTKAEDRWRTSLKQTKALLRELKAEQLELGEKSPKLATELRRLSEIYHDIRHKENYQAELLKKDVTSLAGLYLSKSREQREFMGRFRVVSKDLERVDNELLQLGLKLKATVPLIPVK